MNRIGITTTIPSEVLWAAGCVPVDLNNLFIVSPDRDRFISLAERDGYPRNVCGWIKGIYGVLESSGIDTVIAVTQGDCSNTHSLMETLQLRGIRTIPFAYPYDRDPEQLHREISRLAATFGTTINAAEEVRKRLEPIRKSLDFLDILTWRGNRVRGGENHLWLVSSSDFNGDYEEYSRQLELFLERAAARPPVSSTVRLGYVGVPPILDGLAEVAEEYGARFVYNEVQRQFSMPERCGSIIEQYRAYTYPYTVFHRLEDINKEIERREIHGIVHYVQSFCHRQIEDLIIRQRVPVPVLTLEGETPGKVDERTRIRLQAFVEMLADMV